MPFPNLKGKHAQDSMFAPKDYLAYSKKYRGLTKFKAPKGVIFVYSKMLFDDVIKRHKVKEIKGFIGEFYLLEETGGKIGIMGRFGIGAPAAAALMDELIACGVKRFISIGSAGTLQKNLKIGDIVVCNRAIRDEGTSHHYIKPSKYADASNQLTKQIEHALQKLGWKYILGTSWTIDAPYRETVAEARQYQKEGVATVEMEIAALFAVAKYRRVDAGAILAVGDSLAELKWKPAFHVPERNWSILFEAAKKALLD
jgi:uridine phosphorylase